MEPKFLSTDEGDDIARSTSRIRIDVDSPVWIHQRDGLKKTVIRGRIQQDANGAVALRMNVRPYAHAYFYVPKEEISCRWTSRHQVRLTVASHTYRLSFRPYRGEIDNNGELVFESGFATDALEAMREFGEMFNIKTLQGAAFVGRAILYGTSRYRVDMLGDKWRALLP